MTDQPPTTLEECIRQSGEAWLIDWYAPPSAAVEHLHRTLDEVDRRAQTLLGSAAPRLSESALVQEYRRNPLKVKGFFQTLGRRCAPDMLVMAWRIIHGMEIKEVRVSYHRQLDFEMRVVLESPSGEEDPPYVSSNIRDFTLFYHVGILEMGGRPIFEGFYPLSLREVAVPKE
jgi:hypothetical protein